MSLSQETLDAIDRAHQASKNAVLDKNKKTEDKKIVIEENVHIEKSDLFKLNVKHKTEIVNAMVIYNLAKGTNEEFVAFQKLVDANVADSKLAMDLEYAALNKSVYDHLGIKSPEQQKQEYEKKQKELDRIKYEKDLTIQKKRFEEDKQIDRKDLPKQHNDKLTASQNEMVSSLVMCCEPCTRDDALVALWMMKWDFDKCVQELSGNKKGNISYNLKSVIDAGKSDKQKEEKMDKKHGNKKGNISYDLKSVIDAGKSDNQKEEKMDKQHGVQRFSEKERDCLVAYGSNEMIHDRLMTSKEKSKLPPILSMSEKTNHIMKLFNVSWMYAASILAVYNGDVDKSTIFIASLDKDSRELISKDTDSKLTKLEQSEVDTIASIYNFPVEKVLAAYMICQKNFCSTVENLLNVPT